MKLKSKVLVTALATFLCFLSVAYMSCKKNNETFPCNGKTCFNGGYCDTGKCVCPYGYSDDSCSSASNAKFTGRYSVLEVITKSSNPSVINDSITYNTNLTLGATPTSIFFDDWHGNAANIKLIASIDTINTNFTIHPYRSPTDPQYNIDGGKGSIAGHTITGGYTVHLNNAQNLPEADTLTFSMTYIGPVLQ